MSQLSHLFILSTALAVLSWSVLVHATDKMKNGPALSGISEFKSWTEKVDGDDYLTANIVTTKFLFPAGCSEEGKPALLVLKEVSDLEKSQAREGIRGRISVEAYPALTWQDKAPVWRLSANGVSGHISHSNLYAVNQSRCCDQLQRTLYFALCSGKLVMSSRVPLVEIHRTDSEIRYIGYDDGYATGSMPEEMQRDKTLRGILYYGGGNGPANKLGIVGNSKQKPLCSDIVIMYEGNPLRTQAQRVFKHFGGFSIVIGRTDGERVEMPIVADDFDLPNAVTSVGLQLKRLE